VPMFTSEVAERVPIGLAIDAVNANRLPIRVLEQLPTNRQRWAVAGMIAHRFSSSTLRAEERLYIDSWGLKASTTDAQYLVEVHRLDSDEPQMHGPYPAMVARAVAASAAVVTRKPFSNR